MEESTNLIRTKTNIKTNFFFNQEQPFLIKFDSIEEANRKVDLKIYRLSEALSAQQNAIIFVKRKAVSK